MRRLAEGLDGLIDSMCTNAAFALGKLAQSPNPIVIRDIKQTQFLQTCIIPLLCSKDLAKPLRYALLCAAGSCLQAADSSELQDGALLSCLILELSQTHEGILLKSLNVLKKLFAYTALTTHTVSDICMSFEILGGLDILEQLQYHRSASVYQKSSAILSTYFEEDFSEFNHLRFTTN